MNVIVDTNVLLSAALRDRLPEQVVRYVATQDECRWIVTAEIVSEYLEVIKRPKFGLTAELLQQWAELISLRTVIVPSPPIEFSFPRDPKDAVFLAAALSSGADYLITGDNDLLHSRASLATATRIVSIAEFAAEFKIT
jgi:uncharacterized protein